MSSRCLRSLLLVLPLLAVACGDDSDGVVPPQLTPPTVREIQPTGGPVAGNTLVNIYGSGFQPGAKAFLGNLELQRTVVVNSFRLYGYTPTASSGRMDVRVWNPDGAYGVLVKGFTYEGPPTPSIAQAEVVNGNTDTVSGGPPVGVTVRGAVTVPGVTRGIGQGGGVRAQVGFAAGNAELLLQESYTWEEATYETDSGSGEADIYKGNVLLQAPIGGENREWVVAVRFSIDGGSTWVMADGDGIANGVSAEMMRRVFIARPRVDYCKLGPDGNRANPEHFYLPTDTTLVKVAGQVYAAGITQGAGGGSGVVAQLGYGPQDTDPRTSDAWTWVNATYKTEHGNNDEWEADLPNPGAVGTYRLAFRFSISENAWRVCDADGVNDSTSGELTFSLAKLGTLTVGSEPPKPKVSWCKIGEDQKAPEVIAYQTNQTTGLKTVFAQVHLPGVTDKVGAGPGIAGQLGWGPAGEDPRTSPLWNWSTPLVFNKDNFGANDEWKATLPNPAVSGEYRYAVRFNADGGPLRVCDGNGTDDGGQEFQLDQLGTLNVTGPSAPPTVVGYCKLGATGNDTPESLQYTTASAASHRVVGQVFVQSVTNGAGQGANIVGQLGWGPEGQDPTTSAQWNWTTTGTYRGDTGDTGNNDEYEATLPNPGTVGSFRFAYRFRVNGGAFLYCDADGNTGAAGFDVARIGTLTVEQGQVPTSVCRLQSVSADTIGSGAAVTAVGRVRIPGVTDGPGAGANLQVEVGLGAAGVNASTEPGAFTWKAATYSREAEGEAATDEFTVEFHPAYTVSRTVSMRYSTDGGAWTYCDKDGNDVGGYTVEQQHALLVNNHSDIGYCNLQHPFTMMTTATGNDRTVYGQVWEGGVTDSAGAGAGLVAHLGYGSTAQDPGVAGWTWILAPYDQDVGNNDQFAVPLPDLPVGTSYMYRYSLNGGPYCYGDRDDRGGSGNGFQGGDVGTVTAP
ncbi:IPT/TIG domain-containing protein [Myxococcus sp. RHSTA-1-4]|uniref:IPT/TIG domain-containing protein n=1 Tax=Myxococcus sp. RHSTA-1-4 TaxID=2874601 RepID=UPI001CBCD809|nr:IPT/TIG domain-containing protein [Myxococcus sp. RHSTA-1-4]MBZ4416799.1 IPT/TIG domain-containing protein [Myxococcus sp. RHSTA-1-4]